MKNQKVLTLVYSNRTNKPVGMIVEEDGVIILDKSIKSRHLLQQPPAICYDRSIIEQAQICDVKLLRVRNTETGCNYTILFEQFLDKSFRVSRGFGEQLGVCLSEWDSTYSLKKYPNKRGIIQRRNETPKIPSVAQPALF